MGKLSGDINVGEDRDFPWLFSTKTSLKRAMAKVNLQLPKDAFVFEGSQGVIFYFFLTDNDESDPDVYIWSDAHFEGEFEGEINYDPPKLLGMRLSQYLTYFVKRRESAEAQQKLLNLLNE
ncbi:MAG: hypothetical protein AAGM67_15880 [Bacteroidota bacterium]